MYVFNVNQVFLYTFVQVNNLMNKSLFFTIDVLVNLLSAHFLKIEY